MQPDGIWKKMQGVLAFSASVMALALAFAFVFAFALGAGAPEAMGGGGRGGGGGEGSTLGGTVLEGAAGGETLDFRLPPSIAGTALVFGAGVADCKGFNTDWALESSRS